MLVKASWIMRNMAMAHCGFREGSEVGYFWLQIRPVVVAKLSTCHLTAEIRPRSSRSLGRSSEDMFCTELIPLLTLASILSSVSRSSRGRAGCNLIEAMSNFSPVIV